jgi:hypothetical protein
LCAPAAPAATSGPTGIVFVGSSIFHRWTSLASQRPPAYEEFARILKPVLMKALDFDKSK